MAWNSCVAPLGWPPPCSSVGRCGEGTSARASALHSECYIRTNKMLRRNQRLRKEYLYRKGLEGKERAEYERKRQMKRALEGE